MKPVTNREDLTYEEWVLATFQQEHEPYMRTRMQNAWWHGEDPTEWRAAAEKGELVDL